MDATKLTHSMSAFTDVSIGIGKVYNGSTATISFNGVTSVAAGTWGGSVTCYVTTAMMYSTYYTECTASGTDVSITQIKAGTSSITVRVITTFHSSTDKA